MSKDKVLQIRIEQGTLDNWHNIAKDKSVSLSELVHTAMEKECGVSPFDLGGDSLLEQKVITIEDEIDRLKEFTGLDQF